MDYYSKRDKRRAVYLAVGLVILWWFAQVPYSSTWLPSNLHDNALVIFHYISRIGFPGFYFGTLVSHSLGETGFLILFAIGGVMNLALFGLAIYTVLRFLSLLIGEKKRYDKL